MAPEHDSKEQRFEVFLGSNTAVSVVLAEYGGRLSSYMALGPEV